MSEKIVLITDYTWPSTDPEAEVLARIGAKILVAQSGAEEELLELVPQADAILTCFADVTPKVIEAGHKLQVVGVMVLGWTILLWIQQRVWEYQSLMCLSTVLTKWPSTCWHCYLQVLARFASMTRLYVLTIGI